MNEIIAITRARDLLARHGVTIPPVDVTRVAQDEGFEVRETDRLGEGEAGQTFIKGGRRYIVLNRNDHPHRRRFTIFHEIAHHALDLPSVHGQNFSSDELERYSARPPEEVLCDVFAAECLVPWSLIKPLTQSAEYTAAVIADLADRFQASKPCVASRFAGASGELLAYVVAEKGRIKYQISSARLRDARIYLTTNVALPRASAAARAIATGRSHEIVDGEASDWSTSDVAGRYSVHEEAIHLPAWQQTLSLLTFEEEIAPERAGERHAADDEELLPELTGYLSWTRKR